MAVVAGVAFNQDGSRQSRRSETPLEPLIERPLGDRVLTRGLDILVSLGLLVFLAPLMLLVVGLIFLANPGPALFGHTRIGRGGKSFKCLKFRSMVTDAEKRLADLLARDPKARAEWEADHKLRRDPRITAIGGFLRNSSLDELPQLVNVFKGEMSLVGPRPIVQDEAARYGRYFDVYCRVRPGITGLWQISGRNDVSYRRRVALDVAYVRSQSFRLNLKILMMTGPSVLLQRGSY